MKKREKKLPKTNGNTHISSDLYNGVVAQLVERLICIQEAWGSTPHNSIFVS
jgi:outer membrane lipopolysaccharide assembly protein LptE/RlpB